jgi:hypothetical protein
MSLLDNLCRYCAHEKWPFSENAHDDFKIVTFHFDFAVLFIDWMKNHNFYRRTIRVYVSRFLSLEFLMEHLFPRKIVQS